MSLHNLIAEELQSFVQEYFDYDEESLIDKYHAARGIHTQPPKEGIDGEFIGNITYSWDRKLKEPIPLYKNPRNLNGFTKETRGILLQNGDVYLAAHTDALHDNILILLSSKGIVSKAATFEWYRNFPEEFVAIQQLGNTNIFTSSVSYDGFPKTPDVYIEHFDNANNKHSYKFKFTD